MPCQRKKRLLTDAFGRILRGHRERLGVTLNQLARQIDIDQGLLSKIERGKRPPPQIVPYVQRIAVVLGFAEGSTEFTELMQAAYSGRFGQKWPGGIVSVSLEGGETVATHIPFIPGPLESTHRPKGVKSCTQILLLAGTLGCAPRMLQRRNSWSRHR